jgi:hypothetical protein
MVVVGVVLIATGVFVTYFSSVVPEIATAARLQSVPWAAKPSYESFFPGLEKSTEGACEGLFTGKIGDQVYCTQGFDPVFTEPSTASSQPAFPASPQNAQIVCDGDGESGRRIQMMYVHPPETDRYAQYLASFQQWAKDMDDIFNASAGETGGNRHVRFVHDSNCLATILNVEVSSAAINAPWDPYPMWNEVSAQGYNRTDRIYVIFTETNSYTLGVSVFRDDDSAGPSNVNNSGPSYTSSPVAVWGGSNLAHELMHSLGAVNSSALHSLSGGHCSDEYDRMCYGPGVTIVCSDPAHEQRFDCNHDDYFHTNPPVGSYLATHWNAANNLFLIGAPTPTKTWTGGLSADWHTDGNWSPAGEPTQGYDCIIPAGTSFSPIIDSTAAYCYGKLIVEKNAPVTIGVDGSLSVSSADISGMVEVLSNSSLEVGTDFLIRQDGVLSLDSDYGMYFNQGGTMTVDGLIYINKNLIFLGPDTAHPANLLINPNGIVLISETGGLRIDGSFTNHGILNQTKDVPPNGTTAFLKITDLTDTETKYAGVELTLPPGNGMGLTSVTISGNAYCPEAVNALGYTVKRCYTIDPNLPQTATIRFYYRSAEAGNNPSPDAYHFNESTWDALASTNGGSGEIMYVEATNVSQYSGPSGFATDFALKDPDVVTYFVMLPFLQR